MCSAGWPKPRSIATDNAARSSARVGGSATDGSGPTGRDAIGSLSPSVRPGAADRDSTPDGMVAARIEILQMAADDHEKSTLRSPEVSQASLRTQRANRAETL